jgi:hypothetical protein
MRLEEIYPAIPIAEGQTLSIGMLTYEHHVQFGLYADPDAFKDAPRVAELLDDELRALRRSRTAPAVAPRPPLPVAVPVAVAGTNGKRPALVGT